MLRQMFSSLNINYALTQNQTQAGYQPEPPQGQAHHSSNYSQVPESFSIASCNTAKYLSSQIPQFSGTEEDNVELWIEKLESVARLHGCSHDIMLAAATSRLTKTARRWFDFSTGTVNESWTVFKSSIINRFKRKIFHGLVIQIVEARKWLYYKESFSDYAMDKIALMQPLKLSDEDRVIYSLYWIREARSLLSQVKFFHIFLVQLI